VFLKATQAYQLYRAAVLVESFARKTLTRFMVQVMSLPADERRVRRLRFEAIMHASRTPERCTHTHIQSIIW
jgi:hypothetical protein